LNAKKNDAKKVFLKKGTCSQTFCYLLNREFGSLKENEERATNPLAGGIMQKGCQCGMLWGATLAVGAESYRRHKNRDQAIAIAITATQHLVESFSKRTKTVNCREITGCDWTSIVSIAKYLLTGKLFTCFNLAAKWAPEAIQAAAEGLSREKTDLPQMPINCASEVAKKMGASDEEMVMVAGFAGGLGLSGNGCGALSAALWMNTLAWCKKHPGKSPPYFNNPNTKNILKAFYGATDSEILCHKITGECFKTLGDHTKFIKNGGCDKLIHLLARS
jgi:uncharacterized membrane protein (UPF0136 family)